MNNKVTNFSKLSNELKQRNILNELTWDKIKSDENYFEKLEPLLDKTASFYVGIDPTANSLHIGHYSIFNIVRLIVEYTSLKPIFVIGGFTASIGDPSGKKSERIIISDEIISSNIKNIKKQIEKILKNLKISNYEIINNRSFYEKNNLSILDFYKKYGKLFNVNTMLGKQMVANRLETGISYTEFSYQIFQAIDYLNLFEKYNCKLQIGGSDQWGNIVSGIELIRKVKNQEAFGMTTNLVLNEKGQKIGKTDSNDVIWIEDQKNNRKNFVYFNYQYFFNLSDMVSKNLLKKLTTYSLDEINMIENEHEKNPKERILQLKLIENLFENLFSISKSEINEIKILLEKIFDEKFDELTKSEFELYVNSVNKLLIDKQELEIDLRSILTKENNLFNLSKRIFDEHIQNGSIKNFNEKIINSKIKLKDLKWREMYAFLSIGKKNKLILKLT